MIYFLDDDGNRTKAFRSNFPSAHTFENAESIITALSKETTKINLMCLDHDLGGVIYQDSKESNCGMEVVRYLCQNKVNVRIIVVHSHNHPAAETMVAKLHDSGYDACAVPFLHMKNIGFSNIEAFLKDMDND